MTVYGITTDYEYSSTHKRERLVVWSAPFMSTFEGEALSLPSGRGYMVTTHAGDKIRVECEAPRTDENHETVDAAIGAALTAHYAEKAIAAAVQDTKAEILEDIRTGVLPSDVSDFSTLHDYVDANEYGGLTDDARRGGWEVEQWATVQEIVNAWLKAGRP